MKTSELNKAIYYSYFKIIKQQENKKNLKKDLIDKLKDLIAKNYTYKCLRIKKKKKETRY